MHQILNIIANNINWLIKGNRRILKETDLIIFCNSTVNNSTTDVAVAVDSLCIALCNF